MTEHINVIGPQFDRAATDPAPTSPPQTREEWDALYTASYAELKERGLRPWDDTNPVLMLLPFEWFDFIPTGFKVLSISDRWYTFDPITMAKGADKRFGVLPFGILVPR